MDGAPPPESTSLSDVIDTLPERRLRNLFKAMCERSADFREMARSMLFGTLDQQEDQSQHQTPVPIYKTCINCKARFDVTKNIEERCRYHSGEAYIASHAHVLRGPLRKPFPLYKQYAGKYDMEDSFSQKVHADNFVYPCCDQFMEDSVECVVDIHRETPRAPSETISEGSEMDGDF